jgi:DNA replication protein DnaC
MPFKDWGEVFQDPKIANAILDRILHHAQIIKITGNSYRMKEYIEEGKQQ